MRARRLKQELTLHSLFREALDAKIIASYHINESGIYDTMYLKTGGKYNYDNIFNMVTLGTGIDAYL